MAKKRKWAFWAIMLPIGVFGINIHEENNLTTNYVAHAKTGINDSTSYNKTSETTPVINSATSKPQSSNDNNTKNTSAEKANTTANVVSVNDNKSNGSNNGNSRNNGSNNNAVTAVSNVTPQNTNTIPSSITASHKFGYLSYNAVFKSMPEYATAQKKLQDLKKKYDREAKRAEDEFQRKFVDFIQGQKDFPENILLKRQYELQKLMEESVRFKENAQVLLSQAEKDLQTDMLFILNEAIRAVGIERGYSFIINTDGNSCPFINPATGEDVTNYVKQKLQLPINTEPDMQ